MNEAIDDLLILVNEVVSGVGAELVANCMESAYGWINVNSNDIAGFVRNFFENEVDEDEFDDLMDTVYAEFYSIAAQFNYTITTTY